jgi:NADPH-dependent 2,4-dienoyl-CoA reductase/sulfur reductase-like enzyme
MSLLLQPILRQLRTHPGITHRHSATIRTTHARNSYRPPQPRFLATTTNARDEEEPAEVNAAAAPDGIQNYDLVVVGGGIVGLTLANAFGKRELMLIKNVHTINHSDPSSSS